MLSLSSHGGYACWDVDITCKGFVASLDPSRFLSFSFPAFQSLFFLFLLSVSLHVSNKVFFWPCIVLFYLLYFFHLPLPNSYPVGGYGLQVCGQDFKGFSAPLDQNQSFTSLRQFLLSYFYFRVALLPLCRFAPLHCGTRSVWLSIVFFFSSFPV